MIVSMTGYGQAFMENKNYRINVEIKSVNHRFSEITIRMPRQFLFLEDKLKKRVSQYVQRGKVDVFLAVEGEGLVQRKLQVDWDLLTEFYQVHGKAQEKLGVNQQLSLENMMLHPDVVTVLEKENQSASFVEQIVRTTEKAAVQLLQMRQKEGESLVTDLKQRVEKLLMLVADVTTYAPKVVDFYRNRLINRVNEFLEGKLDIDESRILTEVAIFAEKANVDEEITRLNSHLEQFLSILVPVTRAVVGRKLDFLVQEMNREANTIGSKSNDIYINRQVIEIKAELEKMKEQVQNIE